MPNRKVFKDSDSEDEEVDSAPEDLVESDASDNDLVEESDDDSDAAPDDVTFTQSKVDALRKVKDALTTIGKEKERQKTKRRQKDDQYKEQKKQKLEELAKNRLPDDFLQNISSVPAAVETETPEEVNNDDLLGEHIDLDLGVGSGSDGGSDTEDFIPLGGSDVKAVYIKDQVKTSMSAGEQAESFRSKLLYGGKIRRQPEKARQSISAKRKARFR